MVSVFGEHARQRQTTFKMLLAFDRSSGKIIPAQILVLSNHFWRLCPHFPSTSVFQNGLLTVSETKQILYFNRQKCFLRTYKCFVHFPLLFFRYALFKERWRGVLKDLVSKDYNCFSFIVSVRLSETYCMLGTMSDWRKFTCSYYRVLQSFQSRHVTFDDIYPCSSFCCRGAILKQNCSSTL